MRQALLFGMLFVTACANAQIQFIAALTGADEVPSVATTATGTGSFVFNEDLTELKYIVSYQGLSGTLTAGGHFHVGTPGKSGPIVKAIAFSGDPASNTVSGTWKMSDPSQPLTPALVESLLTGRIYVNFHTAAHPAGEIRGQVTLGTALQFVADLDGVQETPQNNELGTGTGVFAVSPDLSEIEYSIAYRGLTGPLTAGGHIHVGAVGKSGGIVKGIAVSGDPASGIVSGKWRSSDGTQPFTSALVDSLIAGKLYANFHTAAHPGGEIRGQLVLAGGTGFAAKLEASNEVPAVTADGKGVGYVILNATRAEARYAVTYFGLTGTLTAGGHFHTGTAGRSGPVVKGIAVNGGAASATLSGFWRRGDASQPLTTALAESLLSGRAYVNFHTAANPSGEIRGQWNLTTGIGFSVSMDGADESTPVVTAARSSGFAILNGERNDLRYRFTYHGLSGTLTAGGHFHAGASGVSGPVVKAIAFSGDPAAGTVGGDWSSSDATQPLTPALVDSLLAGKVYANYHTATNPAGEIRGQLAFPTDAATGVAQVAANTPASFALFQNYPNPFNPSTTIRFQLAEAGPVELTVFNLLGQQVARLVDEVKAPGTYAVNFNGIALASGTYFYQLQDGLGQMQVRRMLLMK